MSSGLVRQALELVDEEECGKKKRAPQRRVRGQVPINPYYHKKRPAKLEKEDSEQKAEENIKKLLALSKPVASTEVAEKIVARAVKGKPLLEKVEKKKEEIKSILFADEPEESFTKFEREYFCS